MSNRAARKRRIARLEALPSFSTAELIGLGLMDHTGRLILPAFVEQLPKGSRLTDVVAEVRRRRTAMFNAMLSHLTALISAAASRYHLDMTRNMSPQNAIVPASKRVVTTMISSFAAVESELPTRKKAWTRSLSSDRGER